MFVHSIVGIDKENDMEDIIAVSGTLLPGTYATQLVTAGFQLVADEPLEKGGQNTGPSPDTLLCMSLASCTTITLRMYANRKGWDTGTLHVDVRLITAADGTRSFERTIRCTSALSEEQHTRLLSVANKCPIHKILSQANTIQTQWPAA